MNCTLDGKLVDSFWARLAIAPDCTDEQNEHIQEGNKPSSEQELWAVTNDIRNKLNKNFSWHF